MAPAPAAAVGGDSGGHATACLAPAVAAVGPVPAVEAACCKPFVAAAVTAFLAPAVAAGAAAGASATAVLRHWWRCERLECRPAYQCDFCLP